MKWTAYPTRQAFRRGGGREITGQLVGPAPGGGKWTVEPGRKIHLVKTFQGDAYCIAEECPELSHPELGSQLVEHRA